MKGKVFLLSLILPVTTVSIILGPAQIRARLLASGKQDCALVAKLPGLYQANELKLSNIVVVGRPIYPEEYCYAVKRGNNALLARFSEGLSIVKKTSHYRQIYDKWLGGLEPRGIPRRTILKYAALVLIPTLMFLAVLLLWSWSLKRQVGLKTTELEKEIAEHKHAKEELQKHREHLEALVEERTAELTSTNVKLEDEIEHRSSAQWDLKERIKEIACLYGVSKLLEQPKISLEQIFQKTAGLLRKAYLHPDDTCVRVTFNGIHYTTDNFEKSELSQYADIRVRGEKAGAIEVYYLGEKPETGQGPFLKEERALLDTVAEHLGRIAERHQAGEKLQLFRNLIDRSNDGVFVIEPKWGRFLDINYKACDYLGYTVEELLNMTIKDIDESIADDSAWTEHANEIREKDGMVFESTYKRKDGTTFPVEINVKFIGQGEKSYLLAIARDITERKQAEQRQAELIKQIEGINQELKDFAHIISHDLKAPLRGIKTLADWISSDYAEKLDEDGKEQMNLLSSRVQRMHNLIDGVLAYSRVGREKEEMVEVNLNELVLEIIDTLAPPENIEITIEDELPVLQCEQTRIIQVFQNLLSNAVKYMDKPQGQVRIGCVEENGIWKFSVADNGPGIEEKHFEKIFQMFQTLLPRDEFESTGVGLTVVKKIIELYGGKIWVESEPGQGSTFLFTLPKQEMGVKDAKYEANIVSRR